MNPNVNNDRRKIPHQKSLSSTLSQLKFKETVESYKAKIAQLHQLKETRQQEIHDCKRKFETFTFLQGEYQNEYDYLNREKLDLKKKINIKLASHEEEKAQLNREATEDLECLQKHLSEIQVENKTLSKHLQSAKKAKELTAFKAASDVKTENMVNTITKLKDVIEKSKENLKDLKIKYVELESEEKSLQVQVEDLERDISKHKERYNEYEVKKEELQDEYASLKIEFDSIHNKPLDENVRGNSLFAEINDSRLKMEKKIVVMKNKIYDMLKQKEILNKELTTMKNEADELVKAVEDELKNNKLAKPLLYNEQRVKISEWWDLLQRYREELKHLKQPHSIIEEDLDYYEAELKNEEQKLQKLRDELQFLTSSYVTKAASYAELGNEMLQQKWKALLLKNENHVLKIRIDQLGELKKDITNIKKSDQEVQEDLNETKLDNEISERMKELQAGQLTEDKFKILVCNTKTEESVIDLTDDVTMNATRTVQFAESEKQNPKFETGRRNKGTTVVRNHLPIKCYTSMNSLN